MKNILIQSIRVFFQLLYFLILIRILLSWFGNLRYSKFGILIHNLTEPILGPVRDMVDRSPIGQGTMLDFSPVIALFIMNIIQNLLYRLVMALF